MNFKPKMLQTKDSNNYEQNESEKALIPTHRGNGSSLEKKNHLIDEKRKKRRQRNEEKKQLQQAEKRKLILIQILQTKSTITDLIEKTNELMINVNKNNFTTHLKYIQIIQNNLADSEEEHDNEYLKTKLKILKSSLLKLIEINSKVKLEVKFLESVRLINWN